MKPHAQCSGTGAVSDDYVRLFVCRHYSTPTIATAMSQHLYRVMLRRARYCYGKVVCP